MIFCHLLSIALTKDEEMSNKWEMVSCIANLCFKKLGIVSTLFERELVPRKMNYIRMRIIL